MPSFQERYQECRQQIKEISLETPHKVWIALASILLSLLIVSGPVTLLINCIIFNDFMNYVLIGIILCIYLAIFLSRVFYYKTITKNAVENMSVFYLMDALLSGIVLCVLIFIWLFI